MKKLKREAEILRKRAFSFLSNAEFLFKRKDYDLAAFNIEQFCQLFLKYKLLVKIGDFPKTHSLTELFRQLIKTLKKNQRNKLKKFFSSNINVIKNLESAYITSRYIPIEFSKEEVDSMLKFAKKFSRFIEKL